MSDNAPTAEDMKEQYVAGAMVTGFAYTRDEARTDFNQWLQNERAKAWWEGVNDQWKHQPADVRLLETTNPYRHQENQ